MNYMKQVADMLGVELEQEFKLKGISKAFKITEDGMYLKTALTDDWVNANYAIGSILIGDYEVKKPILNEVEKEYLSNIIKPFHDEVVYICKVYYADREWILIKMKKDALSFPYFEVGTKYKGMKANKEYTLEDLEL